MLCAESRLSTSRGISREMGEGSRIVRALRGMRRSITTNATCPIGLVSSSIRRTNTTGGTGRASICRMGDGLLAGTDDVDETLRDDDELSGRRPVPVVLTLPARAARRLPVLS